jgi:hypothetical protein
MLRFMLAIILATGSARAYVADDADRICSVRYASWGKWWVASVAPSLEKVDVGSTSDETRDYAGLGASERLNVLIATVVASPLGGEGFGDGFLLIGRHDTELFTRLKQADAARFGDLCHYRGVGSEDVLNNIGGLSTILPTINPRGSDVRPSFRNTYIDQRQIDS